MKSSNGLSWGSVSVWANWVVSEGIKLSSWAPDSRENIKQTRKLKLHSASDTAFAPDEDILRNWFRLQVTEADIQEFSGCSK